MVVKIAARMDIKSDVCMDNLCVCHFFESAESSFTTDTRQAGYIAAAGALR